MSLHSVLVLTFIAVMAICAVLVAVAVVARIVRLRRAAALRRLAAPHRHLLLTIAAGEDDDHDAARELAALPDREWRSIRPAAAALLGKVRGAPADDLIAAFRAHGEIDRARTQLRSRSSLRRARAAHLLGVVREHTAVEDLIPLVDDPSEDVRVVAVRTLGRIGDARAADAVLDSAASRTAGGTPITATPAWIVAEALLALGDGAAATVERGVRSPDAAVRAVAVTVATYGEHLRAVELVRERFVEEPDLEVVSLMVECLGRVGHPADAELIALRTASTESASLRRTAARALGRLGGQQAMAHLEQLVPDSDRATALVAAEALVEQGPAGVDILDAVRRTTPATNRVVSAALHMAGLRGTLERMGR